MGSLREFEVPDDVVVRSYGSSAFHATQPFPPPGLILRFGSRGQVFIVVRSLFPALRHLVCKVVRVLWGRSHAVSRTPHVTTRRVHEFWSFRVLAQLVDRV